MTPVPVILRARAVQDLEEAVDFYATESGEGVALRFTDALERCFRLVPRHPGSGSPRFVHVTGIPGLRVRPVPRFPYFVFYLEAAGSADVWRVLHASRDLPASLANEGTPAAGPDPGQL